MWVRSSRFILKNRIFLLIVLALVTAFMAYQASRVEMSYEYAQILPKRDPAHLDYQRFRDIFGEEGNLIVVGVKDPDFFTLPHFERWSRLSEDLEKIDGVENILSVSEVYNLTKDTTAKRFDMTPVFPRQPGSRQELDSLKEVLFSLPFYKGLVYDPGDDVYIMGIAVSKDKMRSKDREKMVFGIKDRCDIFAAESGLDIHYSGMPYIRVVNSVRIKAEIYLFGLLAVSLCAAILFLFFRSFRAVVIPLLVVLTGVVWAMGYMALLGYKITLLTGMIPSLLIVIGIPNSVYMLNKYHYEFRQHRNKIKSLQRVIIKIGNATFLTNLTTACGFATFTITNSSILREFGTVASISIMTLFLLALIMIPTIFSFTRPPQQRHINHLESRLTNRITARLVHVSANHSKAVYVISFLALLVGVYGATRIKSAGYMVDDIPENDVIFQDLKFFESHVDGILPLEIIIDTRKPSEALNLTTFRLMDRLEQKLAGYAELASPMSILNILKFSRQAFYNGRERYYALPRAQEKNFIMAYANNSLHDSQSGIDQFRSFLDSARQVSRMSLRVKDIGTQRMEALYAQVRQETDSIFPAEKYHVSVTGSSVVSFKGTEYLVKNLFSSLALAIFLIGGIMSLMFYSWRMVALSLIPNLLPLVFTAAVMGFTGIPVKASTILVFSIAFGISVDNTIHFLTKYRQELNATGWNIGLSVKQALRETGVSMFYTFVILFFGFGVYSVSRFGGTAALGILVSLTLLVAVTSNLFLLPSLLIGLERRMTTKAFREPLLAIYDEEDDIDLDDLEIEDREEERKIRER